MVDKGLLRFGGVDLMGALDASYDVWVLGTAHGTDWGNAEPREVTLASLLSEGSLVVHEGHENREVTLAVAAKAPDYTLLALAEADVYAECEKPNRLIYRPPDSSAPANVFWVVTSKMAQAPDDVAEALRRKRAFLITLVCEPYVRSLDLVVESALTTSAGDPTPVDDCTTVTGWTATIAGTHVTPTAAGGAITATSATPLFDGAHGVAHVWSKALAVDTTTQHYIEFDWKVPGGLAGTVTQVLDASTNTKLEIIATRPSPTAGYQRTTVSAGTRTSVPTLQITIVTLAAGASAPVAVTRATTLDLVQTTSTRPVVGTGKQQLRALAIKGSAPATGSIGIQSESGPLGDVLLHTYPDDGTAFLPSCRPYLASAAATTSDAAATSGSKNDVSTVPMEFHYPTGNLPDAEYELIARANSHDPLKLAWGVAPNLNGIDLASPETGDAMTAGGDVYSLVSLGSIHLPVMAAAPGPLSYQRIVLAGDGTGPLYIDDLFLINLTNGRLTVVSCGTGTASIGGPSKRLWIDSPSLENDGLGQILRGHTADRSDVFSAYADTLSPTEHEFPAAGVIVFMATSGVADADADFSYYPAWAHNAGL